MIVFFFTFSDVSCVHPKMEPSNELTMADGLMWSALCTYQRLDLEMFQPWNQLFLSWYHQIGFTRHAIFAKSKAKKVRHQSALVCNATNLAVKIIFM